MKQNTKSIIIRFAIKLCAFITIAIALTIISYILITGIPELNAGLFAWHYTSENLSMVSSIINTIIIVFLSLLFALPIGVFTALYLTEYAHRDSVFVKIIRTVSDTLSGIPSIVYGLFGYLAFSIGLHFGYSILAGSMTLALMILPVIMRTSEEAFLAISQSIREGSYGLGAGKARTIFSIIIPTAMPGIVSGIILSTGRIIGETAALIYTAGTVAGFPSSLLSSGRTLSVHMYVLTSEGLHMDAARGVAVVLLVLVLSMNALSDLIAKRMKKKNG